MSLKLLEIRLQTHNNGAQEWFMNNILISVILSNLSSPNDSLHRALRCAPRPWKEVSLSMYILWYAAADNASPAMLARNKKENRCKVQGVGSEKCRDAASASWVYGV